MNKGKGKDLDEDRLSILEKVERGEMSYEEAETKLKQIVEEAESAIFHEKRPLEKAETVSSRKGEMEEEKPLDVETELTGEEIEEKQVLEEAESAIFHEKRPLEEAEIVSSRKWEVEEEKPLDVETELTGEETEEKQILEEAGSAIFREERPLEKAEIVSSREGEVDEEKPLDVETELAGEETEEKQVLAEAGSVIFHEERPLEKAETVSSREGKMKEEQLLDMETERTDLPTRRERKLALAERFQDWEPRMMIGLAESKDSPRQWPWENNNWQWMWQNFEHPICVTHSTDVAKGGELHVISYQGDLFIRGWEEPMLKINGAVFDLRMGQDEDIIRIASSTGQLQIWVPSSITRVEAMVKPGDIWVGNISADIDLRCQSGDLSCQHINGKVEARVNGGDVRLTRIEGSIHANSIRGSSKVWDILSEDVTLKTTEGDIYLTLDSVSKGRFRCENDEGDINLLTNGELACELLAEATKGGRIAPVTLPWQRLLERSESKLRGVLGGGGAYINLITQNGRIYIQDSWMNPSLMPSSS